MQDLEEHPGQRTQSLKSFLYVGWMHLDLMPSSLLIFTVDGFRISSGALPAHRVILKNTSARPSCLGFIFQRAHCFLVSGLCCCLSSAWWRGVNCFAPENPRWVTVTHQSPNRRALQLLATHRRMLPHSWEYYFWITLTNLDISKSFANFELLIVTNCLQRTDRPLNLDLCF